MQKQIEALYQGANLGKLLTNVKNPRSFIEEFNAYLNKIAIIPRVKNDETLKGRKRYYSSENYKVIASVIKNFGNEYPNEIIELILDLEYSIIINLGNYINLFKYLFNQRNKVKNTKEFSSVLFASYNICSKEIFGQEVICSTGTKGTQYKFFVNELYSIWESNDSTIKVKFRLEIDTFQYIWTDLLEEFNITFGSDIDSINKDDYERREINLHKRQNSPYYTDKLRTKDTDDKLKEVLKEVSKKLNPIIQKDYPSIEVALHSFFKKRNDVDTDYFITFNSEVELLNDYDDFRKQLINTFKNLYNAEKEIFGYKNMKESYINIHQEFNQSVFI